MIIGLTGQMGAGKSTVLELLQSMMQVKLVKFAAPLYDMQKAIYERAGLPPPPVKDRKLLQWLGTEWGRTISPNLWVNIWKNDVMAVQRADRTMSIVADDCRFDNEAYAIRDLGGVVVRVVADVEVRAKRIALINTEHSSEMGLPPGLIDYTIDNSGDLESLYKQVLRVWREVEAQHVDGT